MHETPIKLAVIVASTRQERRGGHIAKWFTQQAELQVAFKVDLIDLAEVALSLDQSTTPSFDDVRTALKAAEAFVVVTPEYNHSFPAPLKALIDLSGNQWHAKPVGFVSYGGLSGGVRAVEQLRPVLAEMHATTIRNTVALPNVWDLLDDRGKVIDATRPNRSAKAMLHQLAWWARALRTAREETPYAS